MRQHYLPSTTLALCALAFLLPASAGAGQISRSGGTYTYEADFGGAADVDQLAVRMEGASVVFEDTTLTITQASGTGCTGTSSNHRFSCTAAGVSKVVLRDHVSTGTGSSFKVAPTFPVPVEMTSNAPGSSSVQLAGGAAGDTISTCALCSAQIVGNGGNDAITGSGADDVITPGAGADTVVGGDGVDQVRYDDGRSAGVRVDLEHPGDQGGPEDGPVDARDALAGIESVIGTPFDDTLLGCSATFPLGCQGLAGADTMTGRDGVNKRLEGGPGNDTLTGNHGSDDLIAGDGDDVIYAQDGNVDQIDCGIGTDNMGAVDATDSLTNCEPPFMVTVVPTPTPMPTGTATPTPSPAPSPSPTLTASPGPSPAPITAPTIEGRFKAGKRTQVRSLRVTGLAAGSSLVVSCRGPKRSCAFTSKKRTFASATATATLTGLFRHRRLKPGTRIAVTVTTPGFGKTTARFKVRKGRLPKRS